MRVQRHDEHGTGGHPTGPERRRPHRTGADLVTAATAVALLVSAGGQQNGRAGSATGSDTVAGANGEDASTAPSDASLTITRADARFEERGPAEWFTGTARIEMLFTPSDTTRAAAASVSFDPGARTAWHRHPRGQFLIVTAGAGRVQRRGGAVEELRTGDVVWTPPDVEHWHGAAPTTAMTHIAIHEHLADRVVDWLDHVTDGDYQRGPTARRPGGRS